MAPPKRLLALLVLLLAASWAGPSRATVITAELTALGGDAYRAVYAVSNDGSLGSGTAIVLFDVLFDPADFLESSLAIVTPPALGAGWDQLLLGSAPGVPAAYDALALTGGIADGTTASGFAVEFTWLGSGAPTGVQPFAIYDPESFELLESGVTVPEPAALWLLSAAAAVALLAARGRPA
jgi:hypothetical protein